ncbi:MAG TPA: sulfotransferase [Woeseiaceae bacterium]|nr:sulfotransferase [Woeseiaceae bacterium]
MPETPTPQDCSAPFFLVGCSRSGTTLLQALIDAHPNIAIPPESHVYLRFGPIVHTYGDLAVQRKRLRFIRALLSDIFIEEWRLEITVADIEQRLQEPTFLGIVETLFRFYAERHGARRWGDKTPEHIRYLREIRRDFPGARLIHLVRDGRDVAEAMQRMIFYPVTAYGVARVWRDEIRHWQAFCATEGEANTLVVRYEDLVTEPRETVASIFRFLGEPVVDTVATYSESSLSRNLDAQGPWHSSLRKGISASKVGIYRRRFTPREIEILEYIQGDDLRAYGYPTVHAAPRAPTPAEKIYALFADRLVRWYRKLHDPRVFVHDLQYRWRIAYRSMRGGLRKPTG